MSRTSFWLGLALWGLVLSIIVSNGLVIILILMGAFLLHGLCVEGMGFVVYKINRGPYD